MARIRTIKPEFWKNDRLSMLPEATHMLAAALLNYADDYGYFNAHPMLIKGECFPLREPSVSIPESLRSLQTIGYLRIGTGADGRQYGHIIEFSNHQKVSHPTKSRIAAISITWDGAPESLQKSPEPLRPDLGTGNREQGTNPTAASPPRARRSKPKMDPEWGAEFKSVYPSRSGDPAWQKAWRAASARIAEGHTSAEFIAGAKRYAAWCVATNKIGQETVKQAATFLGPDKPFLLPWDPPAKKANGFSGEAMSAWDALCAGRDVGREGPAAKALAEIGGQAYFKMRKTVEVPLLRMRFCRAYDDSIPAVAR